MAKDHPRHSIDRVLDGSFLGACPGFIDAHVHWANAFTCLVPRQLPTLEWVFQWVKPFYAHSTPAMNSAEAVSRWPKWHAQPETERSLREHGLSPLARVAAHGGLGPNLVIAHAAVVTSEDVELLARQRTGVAFCPAARSSWPRAPRASASTRK